MFYLLPDYKIKVCPHLHAAAGDTNILEFDFKKHS